MVVGHISLFTRLTLGFLLASLKLTKLAELYLELYENGYSY